MQLRPYQEAAVRSIYEYFSVEHGNPLIVLPTGAGKSLTMGEFIRRACTDYHGTRIMVLAHVKELLEQNARAIHAAWHDMPMGALGFYSAGIGLKQAGRQITVAGIQSVHSSPATFAPLDLVLVDEAHLVPQKSEGTYRAFLDAQRRYNPNLKIIGLTATPYRMGTGLLTDGESRIFTDIAYEANVGTLVRDGWLCGLVSKAGHARANLTGVRTRNGEYLAGDLERAVNKDALIERALDEVFEQARDRHSWLIFCAGVDHARAVAAAIRRRGVECGCVTGETPSGERATTLGAFRAGRLRALTNCDVLTTGFDAPNIDCIVMLRPTKSIGLYVQMVGRGLRKDESKIDTLVLDFARNVETHGPIDRIRIRSKGPKGDDEEGVAPVKECPTCSAYVHPSLLTCPHCGHIFPPPERKQHAETASDAAVLSANVKPVLKIVRDVAYFRHEKPGKPPSLRVVYSIGLAERYSEWVPIEATNAAKKHAVRWFWSRGLMCPDTVDEALAMASAGRLPMPAAIEVVPDGKYWRVVKHHFAQEVQPTAA